MSSSHISRRKFIRNTALSLPVIAAGCSLGTSRSQSDRAGFVRVKNGRFQLHGRGYSFIGANMWFGCYLADPALPGGRARLVRELDVLQSIGATNLRLLAGSESSALKGAISRGVTRAPGDYDEALLEGLDFCLAEMARRNMKAVLFFSNYWQWSGGFSQYVNWATGEPIPDPDVPATAAGDWNAFMRNSARLYSVPRAHELYCGFIQRLIQRCNTVNGRMYRDDPTIMTWELANEPRPGTDASGDSVHRFAAWVNRTARMIHDLDPNHLVCTGSEGVWGCLQKEDVFLKVHESPAVDYVTVHIWPKNWGWLKEPKPGANYEEAAAKAREHLELHTELATDVLRKPLVLEEFGIPRDLESNDPAAPCAMRDDYFRRMFGEVVQATNSGRALQGANFWAWAGEGRAAGGGTYAAASLLGDPFCEPQGLNSVFNSDQRTLQIIAEANRSLGGVI